MKKKLLTLLLFVIALSCSNEDSGETYELRLGETAIVDPMFSFTLNNIQDSRCPTTVACVWEGEAEIQLSVIFSEMSEFVNLTEKGLCNRDCGSQDTIYNKVFSLIEVRPYPQDTSRIRPEDYIVRVKVDDL